MNRLCEYEHTQRGVVRLILLISAVFFLVIAFATWKTPPLVPVFLAAVIVYVLLASSFSTLTTKDEDDHLAVRFGPLPLFKKRIPYSEITAGLTAFLLRKMDCRWFYRILWFCPKSMNAFIADIQNVLKHVRNSGFARRARKANPLKRVMPASYRTPALVTAGASVHSVAR